MCIFKTKLVSVYFVCSIVVLRNPFTSPNRSSTPRANHFFAKIHTGLSCYLFSIKTSGKCTKRPKVRIQIFMHWAALALSSLFKSCGWCYISFECPLYSKPAPEEIQPRFFEKQEVKSSSIISMGENKANRNKFFSKFSWMSLVCGYITSKESKFTYLRGRTMSRNYAYNYWWVKILSWPRN